MMKRACLSLSLSAGLLAGCAPPDDGVLEEEETGEVSQGLSALAECPGTVWIGKLAANGACPAPGGQWISSALFPQGAPGGLARYCAVQWNATALPEPEDFASLPLDPTDVAHLGWLRRDCRVVAPQTATPAEEAREIVTPSMWETFAASLEAPASIAYPAPPAGSSPPAYPPDQQVHVVVLDSWPSDGIVGRASHGFAMASIVKRLACPDAGAPCPVRVAPALALNLTVDGVDNVLGGTFAFQGRIAQMVYKATKTWVDQGEPGHLILNMSLGWDDQFNAQDGTMSTAVQAVREALEYAQCHGALVLAAAGNASGSQQLAPRTGPMFPAAWESFPGSPLVHAVGGVDALGAPLPSARPGAMPRIVADGYLVPVSDALLGTDGAYGPYSGTSVSTAAATAAAAAVWASNMDLTAGEVVDHLHATGVTPSAALQDVEADFCACSAQPGCTCDPVKRISLCDALGAAASGCRTPPAQNPTWSFAAMQQVSGLKLGTQDGTDLEVPITGVCQGTVYVSDEAATPEAEQVCPVEVLPNETIAPFATPQPVVPTCGVCGFLYAIGGEESILEVGVNQELRMNAFPGSLALYHSNGDVERYDLTRETPEGGLEPGEVYELKLPAVDSQVRHAVIEWLRYSEGDPESDLVGETTSDVALVEQPVAAP